MFTSNYITKTLAACIIATTATMLGSCIKNDIPYPRIQPDFTSFVTDYMAGPANIDIETRTVSITLTEEADIYAVPLVSYTISCGEVKTPQKLGKTINLSEPLHVTLGMYQDYDWVITAKQDIERYFRVKNEVGSSTIDLPAHRVVAYVPETSGLQSVYVEAIKLGGSTAVMIPDLNGKSVDFTHPIKVKVREHGRETEWEIFVELTQALCTTDKVDAWTCVAWLKGNGQEGNDNGFEYKMQGAQEWTRVPDEWVTHSGGSFSARLIHLLPETNYVVRAFSGDAYGNEIEFTTGGNPQLPNGTMDNWWKNGKVWCPWPEGGLQWWDTGNKGAATLGESNTIPTDDTSSGTGKAAMLQTKFVGLGPIGKIAAGNVYVGEFLRVDGTNGILNMGKPFTERPTKVAGYYKYKGGNITNAMEGYKDRIGKPDTCTVWIALLDGSAPCEIRTNPNNRKLFNQDDPDVVAYGQMFQVQDVPEYTRFEVEFNYKTTDRKPTYIIVTASASKLGDFFTGCNGAVMYVDDFELMYDY